MIANIPAAILTLVLFISSYGYLGFPMRTLYMADDIKDGNFGTVSRFFLFCRLALEIRALRAKIIIFNGRVDSVDRRWQYVNERTCAQR